MITVRHWTPLRACLHGDGGPQEGEVTRLAVVEKWPAFTCKLTTPGSRGDVTRCCCVVDRHVNRENGGRTAHLAVSVIFLSIFALAATFQCCGFLLSLLMIWRACKCSMNTTPARRVASPWVVYMAKCDPG